MGSDYTLNAKLNPQHGAVSLRPDENRARRPSGALRAPGRRIVHERAIQVLYLAGDPDWRGDDLLSDFVRA